MTDRIFGVIIIVVSLLFAWGASLTHESFIQDPVGPKLFPYILAGLGTLFGAFIVLRPDENPRWPNRAGGFEIGAAVLAMCMYTASLEMIGFVIATILTAMYFAWRFGATAKGALLSGLLISFGLYAVFHLLLGLSLAKGPFGF